ncbi:MAG: hydrogenase 2 maturation endopeptidase [Gammaproteobacteria bacterium]|nr:MAG: hydrogenase 2 maturation endopeptidase [Gammaproteobacteria bacterium]
MSGKRSLLLGVGNILLSDEGIGVRVIEKCEKEKALADVDIVDGGTAGMELLDELACRPLVVIVDAIRSDDPPGTIHLLEDDEIPKLFSQKLSPHQLGLSDVLSALVMTGEYPDRLFLVGVVPASIAPGIGLTDAIAAKVDPVARQVIMLLNGKEQL